MCAFNVCAFNVRAFRAGTEGRDEMSCLEKLLRHLLVSHDTLRQMQGGRGEVLELQEMIHRS